MIVDNVRSRKADPICMMCKSLAPAAAVSARAVLINREADAPGYFDNRFGYSDHAPGVQLFRG